MKTIALRILGVLAAALIVVDAGAWYQQSAAYGEYGQGYVQAALIEIFLALAISVKLNTRLANLAINLLTVLLFSLAVSVSALQTALPAWDKIADIDRDTRIAVVLSDGLSQEKANAAYMRENKQSTNLALTTRSQRKERSQLVTILERSESDIRFWAGLLAGIALKVTLQLTNLWIFWLAGRMRRDALVLKGVDSVLTPAEDVLTVQAEVSTGVEIEEESVDSALTLENETVDVVSTPKKLMDTLELNPTELAKLSGLPRSVVSAIVNHYDTLMQCLKTARTEVCSG